MFFFWARRFNFENKFLPGAFFLKFPGLKKGAFFFHKGGIFYFIGLNLFWGGVFFYFFFFKGEPGGGQFIFGGTSWKFFPFFFNFFLGNFVFFWKKGVIFFPPDKNRAGETPKKSFFFLIFFANFIFFGIAFSFMGRGLKEPQKTIFCPPRFFCWGLGKKYINLAKKF